MFAKYISYHLKLTGPSFVMDSACSSGVYSLQYAYHLIMNGTIDNAIVGGSNLILNPLITQQFVG